MHPRISFINSFALLLWIFIAPDFANADEGTLRIDLTAADSPEPLVAASTSDGGLWVVASSGSSNRQQHQLLRLDANGNRTVALLLPNEIYPENADEFALFPLADGGLLELDTGRSGSETRCLLRSITREGVVRFERNERQSSCRLKLGKSRKTPVKASCSTQNRQPPLRRLTSNALARAQPRIQPRALRKSLRIES